MSCAEAGEDDVEYALQYRCPFEVIFAKMLISDFVVFVTISCDISGAGILSLKVTDTICATPEGDGQDDGLTVDDETQVEIFIGRTFSLQYKAFGAQGSLQPIHKPIEEDAQDLRTHS
jgi:hypothetical protein